MTRGEGKGDRKRFIPNHESDKSSRLYDGERDIVRNFHRHFYIPKQNFSCFHVYDVTSLRRLCFIFARKYVTRQYQPITRCLRDC